MDNNEFLKLLDNFGLKFNMLSSSTNLKQVKSSYEELEKYREEIIEWVSKNTSSPEQSAEYFLEFGKFEDNLWYDYQKNELIGGIPSFDPNLAIDELYDLLVTYYKSNPEQLKKDLQSINLNWSYRKNWSYW